MSVKRLLATVISLVSLAGLAVMPAYCQFPGPGPESTGSFGGFKILVDPSLAPLFTGCPSSIWDGHILSSPLLYDPSTIIQVNAATTESSPHPPLTSPFPAPPGTTREVLTRIQTLNLATYPAVPPANSVYVRAGSAASSAPASLGEVESESPSGNPANDFPARSFFDVYVQIKLPPCPAPGHFPGATLYNKDHKPLIVSASGLTSLPPTVVYEHNASSEVPILFYTAGKGWKKDQFLGCIVLAGHMVGVAGTPQGGGKGGGRGKPKKGPERIETIPPGQAQAALEKHREEFERHMKDAEQHMPHSCKER